MFMHYTFDIFEFYNIALKHYLKKNYSNIYIISISNDLITFLYLPHQLRSCHYNISTVLSSKNLEIDINKIFFIKVNC